MSTIKNRIVEYLAKYAGRPLSQSGLMRGLGAAPAERREFRQILGELVQQGELVRIKGRRYGLPTRMQLMVGELSVHPKGFAFLLSEQEGEADVYVSSRNLAGAMDRDRVVVRLEKWAKDRHRSGSVIRVLERRHSQIVGRYEGGSPVRGRRMGYVIPRDPRLTQDVVILPDSSLPGLEPEPGQIVIAEITGYPTKHRSPEGRVIEIMGNAGDPGLDVEIAIRSYNLPDEFSRAAVEEAVQISKLLCEEARGHPDRQAHGSQDRLDLRNRVIFTIDGETARDFDDAISVEKLSSGGYRLGVHIADVSYYVTPETALDQEAYLRGCSVYFPDRALPMLPAELSSGICSLKPNEDRLTVSAFLEFNPSGELQRYELADSIIRSRYRLTYTTVRKLLEKHSPDLCSEYNELIPHLELARELAEALYKQRRLRGSLDFDFPEPEVILDLDGVTQGIVRRERNIAHRIIEEFMLAANEVVASYVTSADAPFLYRVHEEPDEIKLREFTEFVQHLGYSLHGKGKPDREQLQALLAQAQGKPQELLISIMLLRSLKLARYTPANVGHYALAAPRYTHFTSPIRRYPDLVVHRLLREVRTKGRLSPDRKEELSGQLPGIAAHCSHRERLAEEAEKDIVNLKRVQFMKDKLGEEFSGVISGVTSFGIFVELDDIFVEGLIHISALTDDYYKFLPITASLVGQRTKKCFSIGNRLIVRLDKVTEERRRLDFSLISRLPKAAVSPP